MVHRVPLPAPLKTLAAQGDLYMEAQRAATTMWRLTGGRPQLETRGSLGRLDFVLQVCIP